MIEVEELTNVEILDVLKRVDYGHLACTFYDKPYVVPVHYAFDDGEIFIYTTEGKKSRMIAINPNVCLQVEEVVDDQHWESVIVYGEAKVMLDDGDRAKALKSIVAANPTLTPAVSIHWMDNWVRENIEVVYKIIPVEMTGRRAVQRT